MGYNQQHQHIPILGGSIPLRKHMHPIHEASGARYFASENDETGRPHIMSTERHFR
jgi:hypothetical protein